MADTNQDAGIDPGALRVVGGDADGGYDIHHPDLGTITLGPEDISKQPPAVRDHVATAIASYEAGKKAAQDETHADAPDPEEHVTNVDRPDLQGESEGTTQPGSIHEAQLPAQTQVQTQPPVQPQTQAPVAQTQTQVPQAPAPAPRRPQGGGGGIGGEAGLEQKAETASFAAQPKVQAALEWQARQSREAYDALQKRQAFSQAAGDQALQTLQGDVQNLRKLSVVDPNRMFHDMTTLGKAQFIAGIGQAAAGGADPMALINGLVANDVKAQQQHFENAKSVQEAQNTIYGHFRAMGIDAADAAKATQGVLASTVADQVSSLNLPKQTLASVLQMRQAADLNVSNVSKNYAEAAKSRAEMQFDQARAAQMAQQAETFKQLMGGAQPQQPSQAPQAGGQPVAAGGSPLEGPATAPQLRRQMGFGARDAMSVSGVPELEKMSERMTNMGEVANSSEQAQKIDAVRGQMNKVRGDFVRLRNELKTGNWGSTDKSHAMSEELQEDLKTLASQTGGKADATNMSRGGLGMELYRILMPSAEQAESGADLRHLLLDLRKPEDMDQIYKRIVDRTNEGLAGEGFHPVGY